MKKTIIILLASLLICFAALPLYTQEDPRIIFTPEEREWLDTHPVITVGPDPNYAPVEFYENGTFNGLAMDYLNWISQTYNIQFDFVYYESWSEIMTALKSKDIQLQTGIIKTPERDKYLSFTDPYSDMPSVLMIRKDFKEQLTEKTLFNYRVGLINDFAVEEYIRNKFNPSNLYELENVKVALESLSTGKVDVLVLDIGQATYYVEKMGLTNVMITNDVQIDFEIQLSFASTKDNSILTSIMDKALKSMPVSVQQEYANKWLGIGEFTKFDTKLLTTILGVLGAMTILFLLVSFWLFTLRKKDRELALVNEQLQAQVRALGETQAQLVESEKINALSRLSIGIAHEINTPLGNGISITSYIQAIANTLKSQLVSSDTEIIASVTQIEEAGTLALQSLQKAAKIIQDFQAVANYQQDTVEKEIELAEEIKMIATILASHERTKCQLSLHLQPVLTVFPSTYILQILSALMENSAIHAYDHEAGPVEISLTVVNNIIHLSYSDFGAGISEKELPNIFEPFFTTQRGSDERLGLGLYNVFNIVTHVLNGQIVAKSNVNIGTSFHIKFPIKSL